ncbi:MAG: methylmalonyl Co-A mutase-associated GTPase MeaB [Syntrophomonadaceae bacterium]|nr:methylmalonyl Co-A mutase-associated GTPase MeaB [Syntrophomonadaceae bacterium]
MEKHEKILDGDVRAASRLIRDLEDDIPEAITTIKKIYPHTGKAHVIGITGSPGAGKSTLTDGLIASLRRKGKTVGVLAVDPTSPFTGGAILGDRVRMQRHAEDPEVFVRSLATRGALGGLSKAVGDSIHVMDSMGKDYIIVETVGIGQQEVEIMNHAHTTLVVLVPGMGDAIQSIKAGIMEIADIFVINKADREGADRLFHEVTIVLDMAFQMQGWRPPIVKVESVFDDKKFNQGIEEIVAGVIEHRNYLLQNDLLGERKRRKAICEVNAALQACILEPIMQKLVSEGTLEEMVQKVIRRESDPHTLAEEIAVQYLKRG